MEATPMRAINPIAPRRCAGASQPALQAILRVTAAQWAQALRAEGAVARAAVIESLAVRLGVERCGRPVPSPCLPSSGKPRP